MSISSVVTRGYISGVNFIPVRGYLSGSTPPPVIVVPVGGAADSRKKYLSWKKQKKLKLLTKQLEKLETLDAAPAIQIKIAETKLRIEAFNEQEALDQISYIARQRSDIEAFIKRQEEEDSFFMVM